MVHQFLFLKTTLVPSCNKKSSKKIRKTSQELQNCPIICLNCRKCLLKEVSRSGRQVRYVGHEGRSSRQVRYVGHKGRSGRQVRYVGHEGRSGRQVRYVGHEGMSGRQVRYVWSARLLVHNNEPVEKVGCQGS